MYVKPLKQEEIVQVDNKSRSTVPISCQLSDEPTQIQEVGGPWRPAN